MPVNIRNNTNSIEIDVNPNLKITASKGGYDVIYVDTGNSEAVAWVYVVFRSNQIVENTIKLDYRECFIMPDETGFDSATELRDTLLEWNIPPVAINGYRSSDESYQPLRLDEATNTLSDISFEHHKIHDSDHYFYADMVQLNDAATQDYMITTPNTTKWGHLIFLATGSAITQIQVYEASDKNGTTLQNIYNNNRNSLNTAGITVHKGTSGGSIDGTLIWQKKSGSATNQSREGMTASRSNEIILKQNTKYIIRITSGTDANLINIELQWYEHTRLN
jgi:hypothetical protein